MKIKFISVFFVSFLTMLHWNFSHSSRVETENVELAQADIRETLDYIEKAVEKLLDESPEDLSEQISEVKGKVSRMTEDISKVSERNDIMFELLQEVRSFQGQSGEIMGSALNSIINLDSAVEKIQSSNSSNFKAFETVMEALENQKSQGSCGTDEICHILDIILQTIKKIDSRNAKTSPVAEVFEKILEMQEESNSLVRSFVTEANETSSLYEELNNALKENQELRAKLQKNSPSPRPVDCNDLLITGVKESGVYEIYPDRCRCAKPISVWCDMENDGGGWTVIIRRGREIKQANFTRSWTEYERGFGEPDGEYWIGNEQLHLLTSNRRYSLRLDVTNKSGKTKWGQWGDFEVASAKDRYKLSATSFLLFSSLGNVFRAHHDQYFTTYDMDNDSSFKKNCARSYSGGWWYAKCYDIHPTGILDATDVNQGVSTSQFSFRKRTVVSLRALTMKIKPRMCTSDSNTVHSSNHFCEPDHNF